MIIDREWLEKHVACRDGKEWFLKEEKLDPIEGLENLILKDKLDWANWLIVRVMNKEQRVKYAVFAAEQVEYLWKDEYPKEHKIWRDWADNGCKEAWAAEAAEAAEAATRAAWASEAAWAYEAAGAARAAAWAARAAEAAEAAREGAWAAEAAWEAAGEAAWAAYFLMKKKILEDGIKILKEVGE